MDGYEERVIFNMEERLAQRIRTITKRLTELAEAVERSADKIYRSDPSYAMSSYPVPSKHTVELRPLKLGEYWLSIIYGKKIGPAGVHNEGSVRWVIV